MVTGGEINLVNIGLRLAGTNSQNTHTLRQQQQNQNHRAELLRK